MGGGKLLLINVLLLEGMCCDSLGLARLMIRWKLAMLCPLLIFCSIV